MSGELPACLQTPQNMLSSFLHDIWTRSVQAGLSVDDSLVQQLRDLLVTKETTITTNQTRISKLESLHKLAQESALKCESQMIASNDQLSQANSENVRLKAEVQAKECAPCYSKAPQPTSLVTN